MLNVKVGDSATITMFLYDALNILVLMESRGYAVTVEDATWFIRLGILNALDVGERERKANGRIPITPRRD